MPDCCARKRTHERDDPTNGERAAARRTNDRSSPSWRCGARPSGGTQYGGRQYAALRLNSTGSTDGPRTMKARAGAEHSKILPQTVALRETGLSVRVIAERVNVSPMTVFRLLGTAP